MDYAYYEKGLLVTSIHTAKAHVVGTYVNQKIAKLQKAYTGTNSRTKARAMADLSALRRISGAPTFSWFSVGRILFEDWPESELGLADEKSYALNAVETSLTLYAYHQQSQTSPVAAIFDDYSEQELQQDKRKTTFARACRNIAPDLEQAQGVMRRLKSVEAANDFKGFTYNMRALIQLIKTSKSDGGKVQQIDYRALAEDLYTVQLPGRKKSVMERWGREYFGFPSQDDEDKQSVNKATKQ